MMEKELGKTEVYISDKPILVGKMIEVCDKNLDSSEERKGWSQTYSFTLEHNSQGFKKFVKAMKMRKATVRRTGYQIRLLKEHPRHILVLHRCLRYNNRLPRWFRKTYSEIAKGVVQILRAGKEVYI